MSWRRLLLASVFLTLTAPIHAEKKPTGPQVEPTAGEWRTWAISSGKDYRVAPPPAPKETQEELRSLADLISQNDEQTAATIAYWDAGAPQYRWMDLISNRLLAGTPTSAYPHRVYTYVAMAMYDATVATWESKYYYNRLRPSEMDHTLPPPCSPTSSLRKPRTSRRWRSRPRGRGFKPGCSSRATTPPDSSWAGRLPSR